MCAGNVSRNGCARSINLNRSPFSRHLLRMTQRRHPPSQSHIGTIGFKPRHPLPRLATQSTFERKPFFPVLQTTGTTLARKCAYSRRARLRRSAARTATRRDAPGVRACVRHHPTGSTTMVATFSPPARPVGVTTAQDARAFVPRARFGRSMGVICVKNIVYFIHFNTCIFFFTLNAFSIFSSFRKMCKLRAE